MVSVGQVGWLIVTITPGGWCSSYPHFIDEETEAQKVKKLV